MNATEDSEMVPASVICERIVKAHNEAIDAGFSGVAIPHFAHQRLTDGEQVFNYDSRGELFMLWEWNVAAKIWDISAHGEGA